jgi:hypothetical protein
LIFTAVKGAGKKMRQDEEEVSGLHYYHFDETGNEAKNVNSMQVY